MNQIEAIIEGAREKLLQLRSDVANATEGKWQTDCLKQLQSATKLTLPLIGPNFESAFIAVEEMRPDFSFPTRDMVAKAGCLAGGGPIDAAVAKLVDYFFENLPRRSNDRGYFDFLGSYSPEDRALGARIELYWARIGAHCAAHSSASISSLARVIMLHELAHYVTHQGGSRKDAYWESFPGASEVVEVVAQMATEDVLIQKKDKALIGAFNMLLAGQPRAYTEHKKIRKRFAETPKTMGDFWKFFADYRSTLFFSIKTIEELYLIINTKEILARGSESCGVELDI